MLTRKAAILAKVESTYGTDPTPDGSSDAILTGPVTIKPIYEKVERQYVSSTLSPLGSVNFGELVEVSFQVELKGSGSAGTAPPIGPLLRACGLDETIVASTSVTYLPISESMESVTIYAWADSIRHKVLGCRGDVTIMGEAGKYVIATFTMRGIYAAPTDTSLPTCTYSSVVPPRLLSAGLSIGGYSPVATKFELGLNNEISRRDSMNAATGVIGVDITARKPGGSIDPEVVTLATHDFWDDWHNQTAQAFSVTVGSSAGNICTITAPKMTIDDLAYGDRNGILTYELPVLCTMDSGDDEIQLAFT